MRRPLADPPLGELPAKLQRALTLHQQGHLPQAQLLYEEILRMQPRHFDALHLLGVVAAQTRNPAKAVELIGRAISIAPDNAAAYVNQALALKELKQLDAALVSLDRAIAIKGDFAAAFSYRGIVLMELNRLDAALASVNRAISIQADYAEAHSNRGLVLMELRQLDAALDSFNRAIAVNPSFAEVFCSRGLALKELKLLDAALGSFNQAIALKSDFPEAFSNRGLVLKELGQLQAALASCDRAISIASDFAEAHYNRGVVLKELRQLNAALASYDRAISIRPDYAEAYSNRGNVLKDLKLWDAALASYDRAILIRPGFAEAYFNRANVLRDLTQYDAAVDSYDKAIALNPGARYASAMRLYARMHICDWDNIDAELAQLSARIERNEAASHPFCVMAFFRSAALQQKAAESWVRDECPPDRSLPAIMKRGRREKLRIGYFSGDFRNHPVAILTAELFETHDRSRFEITAFSFGPDTQDDMRARMERAFDRFIDVRSMADQQIALLARSLEIDIAVDLGGFTADARPGIFALRAAPLQVSYLGYLGTMAADYMDYLIADATIIPPECQRHYSERIICLPSYQVNDSRRRIAEKIFTREELGLPPAGFVFCCFNANYKITRSTFDSWMRILKQAEGSVLFLYAGSDKVEINLRKEAIRRGVDADRLIFGRKLPFPEYLARYRTADLFLDTLPYNAGTTASDALWAGLPVLTCIGEAFAGRVAASLLRAIDVPELIASSPQRYEDLAVEFATEPRGFANVKKKLAANRLTTPLFDTRLFASHLEKAFMQMYARYQADLAPDHIHVDPLRSEAAPCL